jgi:hypothetical protein
MPSTDSVDQEKSGPVGDGEYEVQDGDCVESIAARYGLNWKTIWDHPSNAHVKAKRASPNILLPGDRLHIPPLRLGEYNCVTDKRHTFVVRGRVSKLHLRVLEGGKPRSNEPYRLRIDHRVFDGTTDGDGNIEVAISPNADEGELVVGRGRVRQRIYPLKLGGMDPIENAHGLQKRLRNLGYECPTTGEMDEGTTEAISFFQNDADLETTGTLDDATRQKLVDAHAS